jgi:sirohydrochlorin ferrochelatase
MRYPQLSLPAGEDQAWPPLVVAAHGSTDPRAAATVTGLARLVRARARRAGLRGLTVRAAYLGHALPSVPDALEALHGDGHSGAVVLPLLLTEAYHSDTDLPAVLRAASRRRPGLRLAYGRPLGPHPGLLRALERRLDAADAPGAAPARVADTAVVLATAGSSRPAANASVARLAAAWQSARGWRAVVPGYASAASPSPANAVERLRRDGTPRVVVATYLLAPGVFADQVREQSLAAGAQAVSATLGAAPEVADIVIERYLQTAAQRGPASAGRHAFAIAPDDGEMGPGGDAHDPAHTACHA